MAVIVCRCVGLVFVVLNEGLILVVSGMRILGHKWKVMMDGDDGRGC